MEETLAFTKIPEINLLNKKISSVITNRILTIEGYISKKWKGTIRNSCL